MLLLSVLMLLRAAAAASSLPRFASAALVCPAPFFPGSARAAAPSFAALRRRLAAETSAAASAMSEPQFAIFLINEQGAKLVLSQGDLTKWDGDAIVNAGKRAGRCRMWWSWWQGRQRGGRACAGRRAPRSTRCYEAQQQLCHTLPHCPPVALPPRSEPADAGRRRRRRR